LNGGGSLRALGDLRRAAACVICQAAAPRPQMTTSPPTSSPNITPGSLTNDLCLAHQAYSSINRGIFIIKLLANAQVNFFGDWELNSSFLITEQKFKYSTNYQ